MTPAPTPAYELQRLAELLRCRVLDVSPEPSFQALARVAAAVLKAPIALISLVDAKRQWFMCRIGLVASETPREISFCGHAIAEEKSLVVNDAKRDQRFHDNPLVSGPPHIRAYVGAQLRAASGLALGTLCAIDRKPREWTGEDIANAEDLALAASDLLQSRALKLEMSEALVACAARAA